MKLLLDTQMLVWLSLTPEALPEEAREVIADPGNELFFSPASIWEVAIKNGLNRPDFRLDARLLRRGLLDNGYRELPIAGEHAAGVGELPALHKDPFDRLLLSQAVAENIRLLTSDAALAEYPAPVLLCRKKPQAGQTALRER